MLAKNETVYYNVICIARRIVNIAAGGLILIGFNITTATCVNNRGIGKPNEDLIAVDADNRIFLMLDGITRPNQEYDGSGDSPACAVDRILRDAIMPEAKRLSLISDEQTLELELRKTLVAANAKLISYREQKSKREWFDYYPGAVGIAAAFTGDRLCCVWAGDCIGLLLRDGARTLLTRQQTLKVAKSGYSKQRIYDEVCNHPQSDMAYGIFNGDPELAVLLESSWTDIKSGDTVLLSSDGMAAFLQNEPPKTIAAFSADEMLTASAPYDVMPYSPYADDKAVIRIDFN